VSSPPHVVMVVGNDITVDTRVKKSAASLTRLGYRVTMVGCGSRRRERARLGESDIIRVPRPGTHHEAGRTLTPEEITASGVIPGQPTGGDPRTRALDRLSRARAAVIDWGTRPGPPGLGPGRKALKLAGLYGIRAATSAAGSLLSTTDRSVPASGPVLPWQRAVPIGLDYTDALLPEIVRLAPDVIHAHDVHSIAAAHAAATALRTLGREVRWIYDAHEFIAGLSLYGRRDVIERAGWLDMEQHFAPQADAIITVSPALREELAHRYPQVPDVSVVLNAPWDHGTPRAGVGGGIRGVVGLPDETPLLVYSGVVTQARGLHTVVDAMPELPGVHLAVVSTTIGHQITGVLTEQAVGLGVADRVHIVPPVPSGDVVAHLSTADIGLIPILRYASHDLALTNKLFEYIHAGLPVVVSDCPAQADFVRRTDIGGVHRTADPGDLARTVRGVLRSLEHHRRRVREPALRERYSWQTSERALHGVYTRLLGSRAPAPGPLDAPLGDLRERGVDPDECPDAGELTL